jgi:hypothetical protein
VEEVAYTDEVRTCQELIVLQIPGVSLHSAEGKAGGFVVLIPELSYVPKMRRSRRRSNHWR